MRDHLRKWWAVNRGWFLFMCVILICVAAYVQMLRWMMNPNKGQAMLRGPAVDCQIKDQVAVLEKHGRVTIFYTTWRAWDSDWSVKFVSDPASGYNFTTEWKSRDICEAMAQVYNKAMEIPMTTVFEER